MAETVRPIKIEDEMRSSYLDYAMSVIVARALPDARDGLKPVQRRILYAMDELGLRAGTPYKKSARIVGEVMGKYHPHGDAAIYDAMVRMAQDFSMRYPLVDGQGNFGSVDADPPAAMRYTEARLTPLAAEMLANIGQNTVDFTPNFDDSLKEPVVLPSRLPNLLLNGASGIAVGMATNIPPHNLGELCDAIAHLIDNPEATVEELMRLIPGPDFPSAGIILGREGIQTAYRTGHGRIVVRAKAKVEEMPRAGRYQIVVSELPYQVNKAALVEKIANLIKSRRLEGVAELRDESDRQGMRIVIELRREAQPRQVLNVLYKYTAMQTAFYVNMLALVGGEPKLLTLKAALSNFVSHRRQVITRRSQFELEKAKERAHILEGLKVALDNLDAVIETIRRSQSMETARTNLMRRFKLSQLQAQAILELQLRRLAALERRKINEEYTETIKKIAYLEDLLANPQKILLLVKEEVGELREKYGDPRRTLISDQEATDFQEEDLIPHQEVVVTISSRGAIKRLPATTYRPQRRGGRGITGMVTREKDAVQHLLVADTHDGILFFTQRGRVFQLRCHDVPEASRTAKGIALINLIAIEQGELVTAVVAMSGQDGGDFMVMATKQGEIKKTPLSAFASVRSSGLIAMGLKKGDELVGAAVAKDSDDVIIVTELGQAIRFTVKPLRTASRSSGGVRAIKLASDDRVAGMEVVTADAELLLVTEKGYGKRVSLKDYPRTGRGGLGVRTLDVKARAQTGRIVAARVVDASQEVMIISNEGVVLRTSVESISRQGRATRGVTVMRLDEGDRVAAIARLDGSAARALPTPKDTKPRAKEEKTRPNRTAKPSN